MPASEDDDSMTSPRPAVPWRSPWSLDDDALPPRPRPMVPLSENRPLPQHSAGSPHSSLAASGKRGPAVLIELVSFSADAYQRQSLAGWWAPVTVIIFALTVLAWVYLHDESLPWDADLAMPAVAVAGTAPQVPARLLLLLTTVQMEPPGTKNVNAPWTWDTPTLSRVANANAVASDNLKDLLAVPQWSPQHQAWFGEDLGSHEGWSVLGETQGIICSYNQRLGQEPAAMQVAMGLAGLSQRLQTVWAWPTYYARGVELHQHSCEAVAALLRTTTMDTPALTRWQSDWERLTPDDGQLAEAFKGFYEFERKLIVGPRAGDSWDALTVQMMPRQPGRLFFKPNRTLDLFTLSFRELKAQVQMPAYLRSTQITARIGPQERLPDGFGSPNSAGHAYAHERIWPYVNLMERHSLERARHLVVLTLFAVKRWGLDHGRAPARLQELVPHYFRELPVDPFSGQPISYDAAKRLVYSVGLDLRDDHGHPGEVPLDDVLEPTVIFR